MKNIKIIRKITQIIVLCTLYTAITSFANAGSVATVSSLSGGNINTQVTIPNNKLVVANNPRHIALLLPLGGSYGSAGQAIKDGFLTAYYNDPPSITSPTLVRVYNTSGSNLNSLYRQAIKDNADIIVGPLQQNAVTALAAENLSTPVIALNFSPELATLPHGFFEFGLSTQDEAVQVAEKAWRDGHRNALIIYPNNAWGSGIAAAFSQHWQQSGGKVVTSLPYSAFQNFDSAIRSLLQVQTCDRQQLDCKLQHRQDVDAIFLVATSQTARKIVPILQVYNAGDIATYATSMIYDGIPNPSYYAALNNVYFCDMPWVLSNNPELQPMQKQNTSSGLDPYQNSIRLYALGIDAYALSRQLATLAQSPTNNLAGATGKLYINDHQQVSHQLQWAQFRDGQIFMTNRTS